MNIYVISVINRQRIVRKNDVSWREEIADLNTVYKVGDTVEAKILNIDEDKERISLGIKQLEANPWKEVTKLLPQGKAVEVKSNYAYLRQNCWS